MLTNNSKLVKIIASLQLIIRIITDANQNTKNNKRALVGVSGRGGMFCKCMCVVAMQCCCESREASNNYRMRTNILFGILLK